MSEPNSAGGTTTFADKLFELIEQGKRNREKQTAEYAAKRIKRIKDMLQDLALRNQPIFVICGAVEYDATNMFNDDDKANIKSIIKSYFVSEGLCVIENDSELKICLLH